MLLGYYRKILQASTNAVFKFQLWVFVHTTMTATNYDCNQQLFS